MKTTQRRRTKPKSGVNPVAFERGARLRAEITGAEYTQGADADLNPALVPVRELLTEYMWGKVWSREAVDRRTRSFMSLAILVALNRPNELRVNLRMAVNNGLSREEIGEAILHAAAYAGTPSGVNSIAVAREFFREEDERDAAAPRRKRASRAAKKKPARRAKRA